MKPSPRITTAGVTPRPGVEACDETPAADASTDVHADAPDALVAGPVEGDPRDPRTNPSGRSTPTKHERDAAYRIRYVETCAKLLDDHADDHGPSPLRAQLLAEQFCAVRGLLTKAAKFTSRPAPVPVGPRRIRAAIEAAELGAAWADDLAAASTALGSARRTDDGVDRARDRLLACERWL